MDVNRNPNEIRMMRANNDGNDEFPESSLRNLESQFSNPVIQQEGAIQSTGNAVPLPISRSLNENTGNRRIPVPHARIENSEGNPNRMSSLNRNYGISSSSSLSNDSAKEITLVSQFGRFKRKRVIHLTTRDRSKFLYYVKQTARWDSIFGFPVSPSWLKYCEQFLGPTSLTKKDIASWIVREPNIITATGMEPGAMYNPSWDGEFQTLFKTVQLANIYCHAPSISLPGGDRLMYFQRLLRGTRVRVKIVTPFPVNSNERQEVQVGLDRSRHMQTEEGGFRGFGGSSETTSQPIMHFTSGPPRTNFPPSGRAPRPETHWLLFDDFDHYIRFLEGRTAYYERRMGEITGRRLISSSAVNQILSTSASERNDTEEQQIVSSTSEPGQMSLILPQVPQLSLPPTIPNLQRMPTPRPRIPNSNYQEAGLYLHPPIP